MTITEVLVNSKYKIYHYCNLYRTEISKKRKKSDWFHNSPHQQFNREHIRIMSSELWEKWIQKFHTLLSYCKMA